MTLIRVYAIALAACVWGSPAWAGTGRVAVWNQSQPVGVEVTLPPFDQDSVLSSSLVKMIDLPAGVEPDTSGCLCFALDDTRFAYVHAFYYAHQAIASYNQSLAELGLPPLLGVEIRLTPDPSMPTSGSANDRQGPRIDMNYPAPPLDVFTLIHEVGHLVDYHVSSRPSAARGDGLVPSDREMAEEGGVTEGSANILAALHLGQTSSRAGTSETLDTPPTTDVDQFVRFPDLEISRRALMTGMTDAVRFEARYPTFVAAIRESLADPAMESYLSQPDEYASSAVINQPLWQAALKHGFAKIKRLYLKTLAGWHGTTVNYAALATQLIDTAAIDDPELANELRAAYVARGVLSSSTLKLLGRRP